MDPVNGGGGITEVTLSETPDTQVVVIENGAKVVAVEWWHPRGEISVPPNALAYVDPPPDWFAPKWHGGR